LRTEIYVSVLPDSSAKAYRLTICADGGAGVEATLARGAGRSLKFRPATVPRAHEVRALMIEGGIRGVALRHCPDAIVQLCRHPVSVAEIAVYVKIPLGVVRVLVGDLIERGLVITRSPTHNPAQSPDLETLQAVLDGLIKY